MLLLFLGLLLVLLISTLSIAQTTTSGELTGVVTDPSGAIVPDAEVAIKNTSKGTNQSLKTDRGGAYQFSFLVAGEVCAPCGPCRLPNRKPRGGRYFQFSIIIRSLDRPSSWG